MGQAGCVGCAESRDSANNDQDLNAARMNLDLDSPRTYRLKQAQSARHAASTSNGLSPRPRPTPSSSRLASKTKGSFSAAEEAQRLVARSRISEACAGDDEAAIREAIADGEAAKLSKVELELAAEAATRIGSRTRARRALKRAVQSRNEDELREALTLADRAHLDADEVEEASNIIEELERNRTKNRRQGAKPAKGAVVPVPGRPDNDEDKSLESSPREASQPTDNGLDEASQRRAEAIEKLESAIRSRGTKELTTAIAEAETVGLGVKRERALLSQARVLLNMVNARRIAAKERRQREGLDQGDVQN